jgi:hypothetical protein
VLHAYPFYNSEQSSQRYVKLNEPRAFLPPLDGEARDVYEQAVSARGTPTPSSRRCSRTMRGRS